MKKIYFIIFVFISFLLLFGVFYFIQNQKKETENEISDSKDKAEVLTYFKELNNLDVRYHVLSDEFLETAREYHFNDGVFSAGYSYDFVPYANLCVVRLTEDYFSSKDVSFGVLNSVFGCYKKMTFGSSMQDTPGAGLVADNWVLEYKEACGDSLRPIGLPVGKDLCAEYPALDEFFYKFNF